jgi:dTDP-4-amino-4,6-dideoxygalactose transaminase
LIPVTKSYIPDLDSYTSTVKRAFDNAWLTNRGELVLELEESLIDYLELKNSKLFCLNNGTIPIQIALKLLANGGEVITTPFSYVATTAAIVWENCTPVFVDIHKDYLTINESKIEEAITENTTCILATHVFGNPCNIEAIEKIAKKHGLKVIFDAAHCFGVKYKGKSIFEYGDVSTCSFHATKLFHTGEGGCIFCKDKDLFKKLYFGHNFGHSGPHDFYGLGINGKMSELHAALGLTVLKDMDKIIFNRSQSVDHYMKHLSSKVVSHLKLREGTEWNYSYLPVVFKSEEELLLAIKKLEEKEIFPRRYFYPSLNKLNYVNDTEMVVSENISSRILCLPLFVGLTENEIKKITDIINSQLY